MSKSTNKDTKRKSIESSTIIHPIPEGFMIGTSPDGTKYLVPQYMVPELKHLFSSYKTKQKLKVSKAKLQFHSPEGLDYEVMGQGLIKFPADPDLSQQEYLNLHGEVIALQEKLGISYKDATHWLYMGEVEKLFLADVSCKAFKDMEKNIEDSLESIKKEFMDKDEDSSCNDAGAGGINS